MTLYFGLPNSRAGAELEHCNVAGHQQAGGTPRCHAEGHPGHDQRDTVVTRRRAATEVTSGLCRGACSVRACNAALQHRRSHGRATGIHGTLWHLVHAFVTGTTQFTSVYTMMHACSKSGCAGTHPTRRQLLGRNGQSNETCSGAATLLSCCCSFLAILMHSFAGVCNLGWHAPHPLRLTHAGAPAASKAA